MPVSGTAPWEVRLRHWSLLLARLGTGVIAPGDQRNRARPEPEWSTAPHHDLTVTTECFKAVIRVQVLNLIVR